MTGQTESSPESYVLGLFGTRGSGKSTVACHYALSAHREGIPVFFTPESYLRGFGTALNLEQLIDMGEELRGSVVVLDEVAMLLNSRRSMTFLSHALYSWIVQIRKFQVRVIYTTQKTGDIDGRLISQTDVHAYCKAFNKGRAIGVTFIDTLGAFTPWLSSWDSEMVSDRQWRRARKRQHGLLRRADRLWPHFDTFATASLREILALDRSAMMGEPDSGEQLQERLEIVADAIEQLVVDGVDELQPGIFAQQLSELGVLNIDPRQLGHILSHMDLRKRLGASGAVYSLPKVADLERWKAAFA